MKNVSGKKISAIAIFVFTFLVTACEPQGSKSTEDKTADASGIAFETEDQKISYIIGMNMGDNLNKQDLTLHPELVAQGIKDVLSGAELKISQEEIATTMQSFQKKIMEKRQQEMAAQEAERSAQSEKNKQEGETFLTTNAEVEGVVTTESGLQYKVVNEGNGTKPQANDTVTVHYRGTLIDGTEFDSSYTRGQPATFAVNAVIPGWVEALQLMSEGAKWELYIPSDLAYGPGGTGGAIGPNATLIFEVELLKINPGSGDI